MQLFKGYQYGTNHRRAKGVNNETQETETVQFETMGTHEVLPRHKTAAGYHEPNHPDQLEKLLDFKTPKITRRFAYATSY